MMPEEQTALLPSHVPGSHPGVPRVGREQGFLPEERSPDLFPLWAEITFGTPGNVSTPAGKRIQGAWRAMEGSNREDRLLFVIRAAEAECPGLWGDIAHAGIRRLDEQDHAFREECREAAAKIETLQSAAMREQMKKQLSARVHKYFASPMGR